MQSIKGLVEELTKYIRRLGVGVDVGLSTIYWIRPAEDVFSRSHSKIMSFDEVCDLSVTYTLRSLRKVWSTQDIEIIFIDSMRGPIIKSLELTSSSYMYKRWL